MWFLFVCLLGDADTDSANTRLCVRTCVRVDHVIRHIVLQHFHDASLAAKPKPVPFGMWKYFSPVRSPI